MPVRSDFSKDIDNIVNKLHALHPDKVTETKGKVGNIIGRQIQQLVTDFKNLIDFVKNKLQHGKQQLELPETFGDQLKNLIGKIRTDFDEVATALASTPEGKATREKMITDKTDLLKDFSQDIGAELAKIKKICEKIKEHKVVGARTEQEAGEVEEMNEVEKAIDGFNKHMNDILKMGGSVESDRVLRERKPITSQFLLIREQITKELGDVNKKVGKRDQGEFKKNLEAFDDVYKKLHDLKQDPTKLIKEAKTIYYALKQQANLHTSADDLFRNIEKEVGKGKKPEQA